MAWDTDTITRLTEIEAQLQGVDPRLAVAVAKQESNLRHDNPGDHGRSRGVFHLQEKAAIDAGIDPKQRDDPAIGIFAGVKYLKQQLDKSGGHIPTALSRYNRGTPDYRGIGDPDYVYHVMRHYPEHPLGKAPDDQEAYRARLNKTFGKGTAPEPQQKPGMAFRVASALSPGSAEASTAAPRSRLDEIEAELARRDQQAAPQPAQSATPTAPSPPTARSTPEQDAAYRASRGQQEPATAPKTAPATTTPPGATQAPPAPSPDPSATPGMRFQALPSITQLEPADRMQKTKLFESLKPAQQEEFLRSEEPTAGGLAMGGGPVAQSQPVTDPAALLAMGRGARPAAAVPAPGKPAGDAYGVGPGGRAQIAPIQSAASETDLSGADRPHEAGIPLSAVPAIGVNAALTAGGAMAGAPLGPVGSAAGAALGGAAATRINTKLGLSGQEKPLLETPWANVYPSDLLGAIPLGVAGATSALKGTVRNLPGANVAKHEMAAEKLAQLGQRVGPARPSSELFTEAAVQGGAVPTPTLWRAAGKVVREEKGMKKGFVSTEAMEAGNGLMELMRDHGGNVPLAEVEKYRQRLFQKIKTTTDKAELQRLQDLYGAIHQDLALAATAGTAAGAGTLKAAIAAKRKEHAQETLTDVWSPGKGLQLQEGEHTQIYGKRIRNEVEKKLHQDKLFAGSFTPAETVDIRNTLREVGKLTRMTNPDAQGAVGSSLKWLGRLGGAGGAGYGIATGDLSTFLTGGSMWMATEGATAVLTNAMQSKVGRWALREAIREGNGTLTHGSMSAIAALVAREAAPDAPAQPQTP